MTVPAALTPHERRLRRALVAVGVIAALLALFVAGSVAYWLRYVLPTKPDPFTRGPYVLRVGETSATLRWHVSGSRRVTVTVVTPDGRTISSTDGRLHGLAPGTRYGWVAEVDGQARAYGSVTTAPTDPEASVRFVVFGDYGAGGEAERAVARVGAAQAPSFAVIPGDNSYPLAAEPLFDRNIFAPMRPLLAQGPFAATVGEHDVAMFGSGDLAEALGLPNEGRRWVFDHGPLRFVLLGIEADEDDLPLVRRSLNRPGARRVYLVVHRPPRPGNPVLAIARGRVSAVFAGHNHRYERRVIDGIPTFTVGTGGAPRSADEALTPRSPDALRSLAVFGLLRVEDGPAGVRLAFLDESGRVRDRATLP